MLANMLLRVMSAPPVLVDDTAETDAATVTSGNVLSNDTGTLTVAAVNGLAVNVGQIVAGSNGGEFVIAPDGAWTFDPSGDFTALSGSDTATTSVSYHASNGSAEAGATVTVTVSAADGELWTLADIDGAIVFDASEQSTITLTGTTTTWADKYGRGLHVSQATTSKTPVLANNVFEFDGVDDYFASSTNLPLLDRMTLVVVYKSTTPTVRQGVMTKRRDSIYSYPEFEWRFGVRESISGSDGKTDFSTYSESDVTTTTANVALSEDTWVIDIITASAASGHKILRNATSIGSVGTANLSTSGKSSYNRYYIGCSIPGTRHMSGATAQIVIVPSIVDTATISKIQGRLAHKWDALLSVTTLVDALPADHLYKSAPPTR